MLPPIQRWSDAKVIDEAADRLARLALGAIDGQRRVNPLYDDEKVGYPTRRNSESLVRLALTPEPAAEPGYRRGFHLDTLFHDAAERVLADPGEDPEALDLLVGFHAQILERVGGAWTGSPEQIDVAAERLGSFSPDSLWVKGVQKMYPTHPQTPGSEKFEANRAAGKPVESVANPFTRKL